MRAAARCWQRTTPFCATLREETIFSFFGSHLPTAQPPRPAVAFPHCSTGARVLASWQVRSGPDRCAKSSASSLSSLCVWAWKRSWRNIIARQRTAIEPLCAPTAVYLTGTCTPETPSVNRCTAHFLERGEKKKRKLHALLSMCIKPFLAGSSFSNAMLAPSKTYCICAVL